MPNTNRIIIEGHLGAQPELRKTQNEKDFATCSIAVSEKKKVGDEWINDHTEWFKAVLWGKNAIELAKLKKGDIVCIPEGKIKTRSWEDPKTGEKKYMAEVHAFDFYSKPKFSASENQNADLPSSIDDIPF